MIASSLKKNTQSLFTERINAMIKKLMGSIREYKKDSILAPIYVTLEVVLEVLIPFLMSMIIDRGVGEGDMPFIIRIGLILIVSTLFSLSFGVLSGLHAAKARLVSQKTSARICTTTSRISHFRISISSRHPA